MPTFVRSGSVLVEGATSVSVTLGGATVAGNAILAFVSGETAGTNGAGAVTSSVAGTTFSRNASANLGTAWIDFADAWSAPNVPAGTHTITANPAQQIFGWLNVAEFSGLAAAAPMHDVVASGTGGNQSGTAPATAVSLTRGAAAAVGEVEIAYIGATSFLGSAVANSTGLSAPSGYTLVGEATNTSGNDFGFNFSYATLGSTASNSASWGTINAGHAWATLRVAFSLPAATPVTTTITTTGAGTWPIPADCATIDKVEVWGAGGSGGANRSTRASGGAGGAYAAVTNLSVTPGGTAWYSVGAGGAARSNGTATAGAAGGNSWFNIASNAAHGGGGRRG